MIGFFFLADDEHDGDFLELGVTDARADFFGAGVEVGAQAGFLEGGEDFLGVGVEFFGDREDADLFGGEPEWEGTGEVFDEDSHEAFH